MLSGLRGAGIPGAGRRRPSWSAAFPLTKPLGCSSGAEATCPAVGAPSAVWLEHVLADERQFLAEVLSQRHESLLLELRGKLGEEGAGGGPTDIRLGSCVDLVEPFAAVSTRGYMEEDAAEPGAEGARRRSGSDRIAPPSPLVGLEPPCEPPDGMKFFMTAPPSSSCSWPKPALRDPRQGPETTPLPGEVPEVEHGAGSQRTVTLTDTTQTPTFVKKESLTQMKRGMSLAGGLFEEEGTPFLVRTVQDPRFELAMAGIIMCNAVVMSFQIQHDGMEVGHNLNYRWYDEPATEVWPGGQFGMEVMDYVFGVCYIVELIIKVLAMKLGWFREPWNYLDALIVGLWLVEKPFSNTLQLPADASLLRTARLVRVLRLMKVLRTLQGLDSLYLLLTTLKGSFMILGWSGVLLFVTHMLIAMMFWYTLNDAYFGNDYYDEEERKEVFEYFGTWTRAMLTMFEMTLANWPPVCRLLVGNVSEWFSLFCIFHKLTIGFAVIGVINGVFMQETFKVAATDDKIMVRQREREVKVHTAKMNRLFQAADESGDGFIDLDEFGKIMKDDAILLWLSSMDIRVPDPNVLFTILDVNSDGVLSCEEFVRGALALRGVAKAADLLEMKAQIEVIKAQLRMDDTRAA